MKNSGDKGNFLVVSQHCEWHCEPGCYCTEGKVLSANGTVCVDREDCPCLDLDTGHRLEPGETIEAPDGCNNWSAQCTHKKHILCMHVHHISQPEKRDKKILLLVFPLSSSAPVKVGGSTAPETPVQVSKTSYKFLNVLKKQKGMHDQ